jgi:hypothetical protein
VWKFLASNQSAPSEISNLHASISCLAVSCSPIEQCSRQPESYLTYPRASNPMHISHWCLNRSHFTRVHRTHQHAGGSVRYPILLLLALTHVPVTLPQQPPSRAPPPPRNKRAHPEETCDSAMVPIRRGLASAKRGRSSAQRRLAGEYHGCWCVERASESSQVESSQVESSRM